MKISECCNNSLLSRCHPGNGVSVLFLAELGQLNMRRQKTVRLLILFFQSNYYPVHTVNISVL